MVEVTDNFIRIPVRPRQDFIRESFKTTVISVEQGIKAIVGKLKSDPSGGIKVRVYLFNRDNWTLASARAWIDQHGGKTMKNQYLKGYVENIEKAEDGILSVAVATDLTEDRDGEVVNPAGVDLNNFLKNPVLLWAHDYRLPPIGKVVDIRKEDNRILFTPQFNMQDSHAKSIWQMFKDGFLNAFSIGFMLKERDGKLLTKTELLEISAVPVPSNPNATVLMRSKGYDENIIKEIEAYGQGENTIEKEKEESFATQEKVEEIEKKIDSLSNEFKEVLKSLGEKITAIEGAVSKDAVRSKQDSEVSLVIRDVKRLLQAVDKSVGSALGELKSIDK